MFANKDKLIQSIKGFLQCKKVIFRKKSIKWLELPETLLLDRAGRIKVAPRIPSCKTCFTWVESMKFLQITSRKQISNSEIFSQNL